MVKKEHKAVHPTHHEHHTHVHPTTISTSGNIEHKLIENMVELQKVHVDLAGKFDKLSKQISDLLTLFEMAARTFAKTPGNDNIQKDKEFLDKIDKLLEQNKTIAKGLTLMEEKVRERTYGQPASFSQRPQIPQNQTPNSAEEFNPGASARPLPKF